MAVLGIPPGPLVGRAYRHLLELRMERGPLPHDEAVAELRAWYRDQEGSGGGQAGGRAGGQVADTATSESGIEK